MVRTFDRAQQGDDEADLAFVVGEDGGGHRCVAPSALLAPAGELGDGELVRSAREFLDFALRPSFKLDKSLVPIRQDAEVNQQRSNLRHCCSSSEAIEVVMGDRYGMRRDFAQAPPCAAAVHQTEEVARIGIEEMISERAKRWLPAQDVVVEGLRDPVLCAARPAQRPSAEVVETRAPIALATRLGKVSPAPVAVSAGPDDPHDEAVMPAC